jgi:hypothetical protein
LRSGGARASSAVGFRDGFSTNRRPPETGPIRERVTNAKSTGDCGLSLDVRGSGVFSCLLASNHFLAGLKPIAVNSYFPPCLASTRGRGPGSVGRIRGSAVRRPAIRGGSIHTTNTPARRDTGAAHEGSPWSAAYRENRSPE